MSSSEDNWSCLSLVLKEEIKDTFLFTIQCPGNPSGSHCKSDPLWYWCFDSGKSEGFWLLHHSYICYIEYLKDEKIMSSMKKDPTILSFISKLACKLLYSLSWRIFKCIARIKFSLWWVVFVGFNKYIIRIQGL